MNVSIFSNAMAAVPVGEACLDDVLRLIAEGRFIQKVERYRTTKDKHIKKTMPCFTASGVFEYRSKDDLIAYNGVLCLDIDKKDNESIDLEKVVQELRDNRFIYAFHKSVGGEGYAVYIKIKDAEAKYHSQYFDYCEAAFSSKYGVVLDKACSDVSRLRFVSYDCATYINTKSEELPITVKKESAKRETKKNDTTGYDRRFFNLLYAIVDSGVDITDRYEDWVNVAFAISSELGEEGRDYFHQISQASNKYKVGEADRLYSAAIKRMDSGRSNIKTKSTLFELCKRFNIFVQ